MNGYWDPHSDKGWRSGEYERFRQLLPDGMQPDVRPGFPGWHIECSAMARARLGATIDVHTGGEDNIFPHHECEIAQSYGAKLSPDSPTSFSRYWVHSRHLLVNGAKMSKRDGTLITAKELFDPRAAGRADLAQALENAGFAAGRVSPPVLRFALISTPFTNPMNFTVDVLVQAKASLDRFQGLYDRARAPAVGPEQGDGSENTEDFGGIMSAAKEDFDDAIGDNLNMPRALAAVFRVLSWANQRQLSTSQAAGTLGFLEYIDEILGVLNREPRGGVFSNGELEALAAVVSEGSSTDGEVDVQWVKRVLALRYAARQQRNFGRADEIRNLLAAKGVIVEDQPGGVGWRIR